MTESGMVLIHSTLQCGYWGGNSATPQKNLFDFEKNHADFSDYPLTLSGVEPRFEKL